MIASREQRALDHRPPTRNDWRSLGRFAHERIEPGGIGDLGSGCAVEAIATRPLLYDTRNRRKKFMKRIIGAPGTQKKFGPAFGGAPQASQE